MEKKINIIDAGLSPKTLEQLDLVGINGGLTEQTEGNYCTVILTPVCPMNDFTICVWERPECSVNIINN